VRALERDAIAELHQRFLGAQHVHGSFVGDFDPDEVQRVLEAALGGWVSAEPYERIRLPHRANAALEQTLDTPDKKMAGLGIALAFAMTTDDPDYPALRFANYVFGESPSSRLFRSLREREGLSYSAGSAVQVSPEYDAAFFSASAIAAPENAPKARALLKQEFEGWLEDPISEDELAEFRVGYLERFRRSLSDDGGVASALLTDLRLDRPFTDHRDLVDRALAVSVEELRSALRKHLASKPLIDVVAGDVAKFGQAEAASD